MMSLKMNRALNVVPRLSMACSARSASSMGSGKPGLFVNLVVDKDFDKSSIKVTGSLLKVITEEQRELFGMGDAQLKQKVNDYFGKAPNDVYTSDPTPWNNLYKSYGWEEVHVLLKPVSAEIIGVTSDPVILATKTLSNTSNITGEFHTSISENVTNSFGSTTTNSLSTTINEEVSYGIEGIAGGKIGFEFTSEFSETTSKDYASTVGAESGVTVTLKPDESVIAKLSSFRGTLNARVKYEASLHGSVALNYNPTFKGHHFWGLGVGSIMGPTKQIIEEDMKVSFYSTGSVNLVNMATVNFMRDAGQMGTVGEMGTDGKHFLATAGTQH